ncbi:MAG: LysR family transcriptional regulator [Pseudomonadota bacterium]
MTHKPWSDIKSIPLFLQIADAGSFSRASALLGISQPALSRHVGAMEKALGARVFYRDGRGVRLTEAGRRLQTHGKNIMVELAEIREGLGQLGEGFGEHVVIGLQPGIARLIMVPVVQRAMAELPEARLRFMEGPSGDILQWLAEGRIDLALYYDQPNLARGNADPILTQDHLLVGPVAAKLSTKVPVPASRLAEVPLILPGRPHGVRVTMEALAQKKGFDLNIVLEVDSATSILTLIAAGIGYGVLPPTLVTDDYRRGQVSTGWIVKPRVTRTMLMASAPNRPFTGTARRLTQIIRQEADRASAEATRAVA